MLEEYSDASRCAVLLGREPDRDAEERLHRHIQCDAHALHGAAQNHAFGMEFDMAHPLVRHGIVRRETDGQCERVEPRGAARPGGGPAELGLTPQNTLPAGLFLLCPDVARSMPRTPRNGLNAAG